MLRILVLVFLMLVSAQLAKADDMPQAVVGIVVTEGSLSPVISAVGTFTAYNDVLLKAETAGRIEAVHFKEGDHVQPDKKLFTLHNEEQKLKVQLAQAALDLSKSSLERKKTLVKKGFVSKQLFEEVRYAAKVAEAELSLAKEELSKTVVRAPFDGDLSNKVVSVGAFVNEGDDLVHIQDITPIRLIFHLPENEIKNIKPGDKVVATTDLYTDKKFPGTVETVEPRIDEKSRTAIVHATFPNQQKLLIPGLYGRVTIETTSQKKTKSVQVPEQALVIRPDGTYVYKIKKDKAILTKVSLGIRTGDEAQVLSGLKGGDQIVLEGQDKLQDGSDVTVEMKQ